MDVVIVTRREGSAEPPRAVVPGSRFSRLPEPVHLEDTIATHDAEPRPNVDDGRDAERDFMLRYAG